MNNAEIMELLGKFPSLTSTQVDKCRVEARKQILKIVGETVPELEDHLQYIGEAPREEDYDLSNSWLQDMKRSVLPLDYLIPPILFVLLMISLTHMLAFSGSIGQGSWSNIAEGFEGWSFTLLQWVLIHQIGFFAMSEIGVIYFYSWNSMSYAQGKQENKYLAAKFIISSLFATITVIANVVSLTHNTFEDGFTGSDAPQIIVLLAIGILIPVTTMYLGERLAEVLLEVIEKRDENRRVYDEEKARHYVRQENARNQYQVSLLEWQGYHQDETTHDKYRTKFALAIVSYFKRYIKYYEDDQPFILPPDKWTPELERLIAAREIAYLTRMSDLDEAIAFFAPQGEQSQ